MNPKFYPTPDQARKLKDLFPDSEMVWASYKVSCILNLDDPPYFLMKRWTVENPRYEVGPAPSIGEMGEWLKNWAGESAGHQVDVEDIVSECIYTDPNEAQARAAAIIEILPEKVDTPSEST